MLNVFDGRDLRGKRDEDDSYDSTRNTQDELKKLGCSHPIIAVWR